MAGGHRTNQDNDRSTGGGGYPAVLADGTWKGMSGWLAQGGRHRAIMGGGEGLIPLLAPPAGRTAAHSARDLHKDDTKTCKQNCLCGSSKEEETVKGYGWGIKGEMKSQGGKKGLETGLLFFFVDIC